MRKTKNAFELSEARRDAAYKSAKVRRENALAHPREKPRAVLVRKADYERIAAHARKVGKTIIDTITDILDRMPE